MVAQKKIYSDKTPRQFLKTEAQTGDELCKISKLYK